MIRRLGLGLCVMAMGCSAMEGSFESMAMELTAQELWQRKVVAPLARSSAIQVYLSVPMVDGGRKPGIVTIDPKGRAVIDYLDDTCREVLTGGVQRFSCRGVWTDDEPSPAAGLSVAIASAYRAPHLFPVRACFRSECTFDLEISGAILGQVEFDGNRTLVGLNASGEVRHVRAWFADEDEPSDYPVGRVDFLDEVPGDFFKQDGRPTDPQLQTLRTLWRERRL